MAITGASRKQAGLYYDKGGAEFNPLHPDFNAKGDGVADDTTPLADTLTAGSGKRIIIPPPSVGYLVTGPNTVPTKTMLQGGGRGSLIKTATVSTHLLVLSTPGAILRALALQGVKGSTVLNNSAVVFRAASEALVEDCEAFGMSGDALLATGGASRIRLFRNYIHGLTPDALMGNSADIAFYSDANYCVAAFNRLLGGAQTEVGVILQDNSLKHLVIGNEIGAHYSYGIIDYDTTPRTTNSIIVLNRIEDIDGTGGSGTKGSGIYMVSTGGQIVAHNQLRNTNINTTTETLAPGAIGVNAAFSPMLIEGNVITAANWYGLLVVSSTSALVTLRGNIVVECLKTGIYVHSSSHVSIEGGSVTSLTATPLTARCVGINYVGGGPFTNVSVKGIHTRGGAIGIDANVTNKLSLIGNTISEVGGASGGIRVQGGDAATVSDNNVDVTTNASAPALSITNMTNSTFKGNVLKSTSTTCVVTGGVNTGSVFDQSNVLVGMNMNNVNNAGTGMKFTLYGTAAPTAGNHQPGDRVINSAPAVGSPKSWVCTVAGLPGTWVSEGNL